MAEMTIGKLAREAGVHLETIRYYQRRSLLAEPTRPAGGVRRYPDSAIAQLRFIKRAQGIGFSLDEVKQLLKLQREPGCSGARALARAKASEVDQRIADLQRVRKSLHNLIAQCDAGGARSCPIIESLSADERTGAASRPGR
jgi:MerR family transcriptional regulator, mercuric resistance operon regulatory protein